MEQGYVIVVELVLVFQGLKLHRLGNMILGLNGVEMGPGVASAVFLFEDGAL